MFCKMSRSIQTSKPLLAALVLSILIVALLMTAITFEFYVEELAKAYVVPMLVATTITTLALVGTIASTFV